MNDRKTEKAPLQTMKVKFQAGSYKGIFPKNLFSGMIGEEIEFFIKREGNKITMTNENFYPDLLFSIMNEIIKNENLSDILTNLDLSILKLKRGNYDPKIQGFLNAIYPIIVKFVSANERETDFSRVRIKENNNGFTVSF